VADEVVAEHHRRLVAAEVVDRGALAPQLRLVEHVVVDERGHVDHLDDGGERDVGVGEPPARAAAQQQQQRAEHLAAEAADVLHQHVDARQVARQFLGEDPVHGAQLVGDAVGQRRDRPRGRGARRSCPDVRPGVSAGAHDGAIIEFTHSRTLALRKFRNY
jgi:hypothetical protein